MGFLKNIIKAATVANQPEMRTVVFDQDWQDTMESLRLEFQGKNAAVNVSIPDDLCEEICTAIEFHKASARILYSDNKTAINNVGESYAQEDLQNLCGGKSGEEMDWLAGFLMPEILNPYDKTAVSVHAIIVRSDSEKIEVFKVGYMDKESAKKVHRKILNLLGKDQYVPLLIRMTGGTKEKPNYGAFPYVMTDKIKFD